MYKLKLLLPFLLLLSGTYMACNKDNIKTFGPSASVTFAGRIIDENGQGILDAQVRVGGELATTDKNGVFRLEPVREDSRNAILKVNKIGYFDFSRAYLVQDGAIQTLTIQLLKKQQVGTVNGSSGGSINVPGGAKITFPAGSVATKSGTAFSGTVRVFARYLDPTDPDLSLNMPGDLRAINTNSEEGVLSTFGMMGVELEGQPGQELQVTTGSEVEIRMPIPAEKAGVAPAEIALWHYDVDEARWKEEGTAQKIGNEYVGMVKHFSFWNCDAFSETVYMEGKVFLGNNQSPLANIQIRLTVLANGFQGYALTNGGGWFGGAIPKDMPLKLELVQPWNSPCAGQVLYSEDIGPFSSNTILPDIILSTTNVVALNIQGHIVDCTGSDVSNGYAKVMLEGVSQFLFGDTNGNFETNALICSNINTGTAMAYDLANLLESTLQSFNITSNTVNLGDIEACNSLTEFIKYTLDGQSFTKINPSGSVFDTIPVSFSKTYIVAEDTLPGFIVFDFTNNNQPGTFLMNQCTVNNLQANLANGTLSTTVTTAASQVGDPIIGTFGDTFIDFNGITHTITGSYRVIRDW